MSRKKHIFYALMMFVLTFILIFVGNRLTKKEYSNELISETAFYFDTFITIQVYDCKDNYNNNVESREDLIELIDNALALCGKYEMVFSKTNINSELYKLNNSSKENIKISKELYDIIDKSLYYSKLTDGKFDVTISKLSDVWNFKKERVPDELMIFHKLRSVDYNNIALTDINDNYYITLKNDTEIDLGGIAKGYIADKLKFYLTKNGISSGIINLGGNIVVIGDKPNHSDYNIGIQEPFSDDGTSICSVNVSDKSVVTSGVYERMFEKDGVLYHHIIDPDTGYPSDSGLYSATIISDKSVDGDALSTICVLLGASDAIELINSIDGVECILVTEDYELILSEGLNKQGKVISLN